MYSLDMKYSEYSPINKLNNVHLWRNSISFKSIVFWETEGGKGQLNYCPVRHVFNHFFHLRDYHIIDFVWNFVVINFGIAQDHKFPFQDVQNLKLWR